MFRKTEEEEVTSSNGMNASASSSEALVFLHEIHQQLHGMRFEVDISVECEEISVLSDGFFAANFNGQVHQLVAKPEKEAELAR